MKNIMVRESVRGIIEYILKVGSLDDRYMGKNRALEGTIAHQKLQESNEEIYQNYNREVKLSHEFIVDDITLVIDGRADGIIIENNIVYIEEIKSTMRDLIFIEEDYNDLHWAQGKFYAYIYGVQNKLEEIYVRLSYFNVETEDVKSFDKKFTILELEEYINEIINEYKKWVYLKSELIYKRNKSIKTLEFPFERYRKGQRELAINSYNTIKEKAVLFAQAPTGIGKTISTLFPAIKALGVGKGDRIVYLTAKTITRTVAEESIQILKNKGLDFRNVTLTAKEKICFKEKVQCNPEYCEYAKEYYDKVNNAIYNMLQEDTTFSRNVIEKYSREYKLCPFELSLDLSLWCDGIVCDYNYAFDPRARLKRLFEDDIDSNILLIDEGHNLVDRARNMFSAEISKSKVLKVSKLIKGKSINLYKSLNLINKELIEIRRELEEENVKSIYKKDEYKNLYKLLRVFLKEGDEYLVKAVNTEGYEEVKDIYFEFRKFISASELYDDNYVTLIKEENRDLIVRLFCVNPSKNLSKIIQGSYSSIIFSATLSPLSYYIDLLGGDSKSYRMKLDSPFKKENLKIYKYPLNMRYKQRENNIEKLCRIINKFIKEEIGNYMVFLPSYSYLKKVYEKYIEIYTSKDTICQEEALGEIEKEQFLSNFYNGANITAFCVIGGIFSEGIDLPGKKLIGCLIVGVGFPKISVESDIIRDYYEEKGFDYAYIYPGINKVMQAAGRVIRTETDKGRLMLIDDRYNSLKYKNLIPKEWNNN